MGRMEEIWGADCLEFKPERWISNKGELGDVSPYRFTTFNAGPRACIGKELAMVEMKAVGAAVIWNYSLQVVENHPILPSNSIVLHMKHGLKWDVIYVCPTIHMVSSGGGQAGLYVQPSHPEMGGPSGPPSLEAHH
ncbi:hypothetical protein DKX38_022821 [Salix brachista]|uniref:Cytochrome P450 n=1 Tax=Salix brachista TaxID=2182728 RepID=A0A5N5K154_9ROSI|nr:hypothetical protein DKX38_022821 [Salix brachista]